MSWQQLSEKHARTVSEGSTPTRTSSGSVFAHESCRTVPSANRARKWTVTYKPVLAGAADGSAERRIVIVQPPSPLRSIDGSSANIAMLQSPSMRGFHRAGRSIKSSFTSTSRRLNKAERFTCIRDIKNRSTNLGTLCCGAAAALLAVSSGWYV
eukprot:scaffold2908_cov105-Isochrysis_galbana.AAC.15